MNRDKLIELANNAFYDPNTVPAFQNDYWTITTDELEAFANAIIEECAKVCDAQFDKDQPHQDAGNQPDDYRTGYADGSGDCGHAPEQ